MSDIGERQMLGCNPGCLDLRRRLFMRRSWFDISLGPAIVAADKNQPMKNQSFMDTHCQKSAEDKDQNDDGHFKERQFADRRKEEQDDGCY